MQRPFPAQAAAPLSVIQCRSIMVAVRHLGRNRPSWRRSDHEAIAHGGAMALVGLMQTRYPGLIWLTDPGSTIEMALTTTRLRSSTGRPSWWLSQERSTQRAPHV